MPEPEDDEISEASREAAARVLRRAAEMPGPEEIARIADEAIETPGHVMTDAEIRRIAGRAASLSRELADLMKELGDLLGDGGADAST